MADVPIPSIEVVEPSPTSFAVGVVAGGVVKNLKSGPSFDQLASEDGAGYVVMADGRTVEERIAAIPAEVDAAGTAEAKVMTHNSDAAAHPALSAFITAEADRAQDIADTAAALQNYFPTTPVALSNGVLSLGTLVAGSGGTDGTFDIGFSGGGGAGASGKFVVSGGVITQLLLTTKGANYTSAPTLSFSASSGLTGASAIAIIGTNAPVNTRFSTPSPVAGESAIIYDNVAGVATERARIYSSDAAFGWRTNITPGVSLNTLVKQGVYFGTASAGYTDLPPGWNPALTFYVVVTDMTAVGGRFKQQKFHQFETPQEEYIRRLDTVGSGTTTWFYGAKVPDLSIVTAKINAKAVTRAKLSDNYSDSGTISAATDLNTIVVTGNSLVAGAVVNGPTGAEVSGFLEVTVHGLFILQIYRNLSNPSVGWSRYIRPGTSFYGAWTPLSTVAGLPFAGQNWVFFGDSITENGDYPARVATRLGLTAHKQGYGGCRMGKHIAGGSGPLYTKMSAFNLARYINIDDYSELITAANDLFTATGDDNRTQANALAAIDWSTITGTLWAFGTNDFGLSDGGLPVGTTSDVTEDTFCGAMYLVITRMQTAYPALKIGFIGPLWRGRQEVGDGKDSDLVPNPNGFYLIDYQNAMIAMGKKFHVPVYDAYSRSGFNALTDATLLADQLHPSSPVGYQRHADNISASMNATF